LITVLIGGHWMGDEAFQGAPEIAETDAQQYVEQNLNAWELLRLFGPHLSQELSLQSSDALALFRNALAGVQGAPWARYQPLLHPLKTERPEQDPKPSGCPRAPMPIQTPIVVASTSMAFSGVESPSKR
jgi:hypothetical protein